MKLVKLSSAALAASLLVSTAAQARTEDRPYFPTCDGMGSPIPPKPNGDAPERFQWGRGAYGVQKAPYGPAGVAACAQALADPLLEPRYRDRRVNLLRAYALHQIGAKQFTQALATIDLFDSTIRREPNYDQTVGLGSQALRAIAYYRLDRKAEAEATLGRIAAARPYSASIQSLAHSVKMVFDPDRTSHDASIRAQAVLSPAQFTLMFWRALSYSQFDEALSYSRQISFDLPKNRGGWTITGGEDRKYELIADRASLAGANYYALSALGRSADAARVMASARADIEDSIQPPIPVTSPDFNFMGGNKRKDWEKRKAQGTKAVAMLDDWTKAVAFRAEAPKHSVSEIADMPGKPSGDASIIITDILRRAKIADAKDKTFADLLIEALEKRNELAVSKAIGLSYGELIDMLPVAETDANRPKIRGELGPLLNDRMDAYAIFKAEDPALFNIRFGGATASRAALEEATLLMAANHAATLGNDGIIIEARQVLKRTLLMNGNPIPQGNEVRLLVRPVTLANLPAERRDAAWRVLKVADIRAALAAKYPTDR